MNLCTYWELDPEYLGEWEGEPSASAIIASNGSCGTTNAS